MSGGPYGSFSGEPAAVWLTEEGTSDRRMRLLESFAYVDAAGKAWVAPAGSVVDGASIPRALWSLLGSPYTGDYRRASIVHDVACDAAGSDRDARRAADRMFWSACRAGGCSAEDAALLYVGVRLGAIRRTDPAGVRAIRTDSDRRLERRLAIAARHVLARGAPDDPAEVERRTDAALASGA